jgi:hypothetical protein
MSTRSLCLVSVATAILLSSSAAGAEPWDGEQKWAVGLHGAALGLEPADAPEDKIELAGHGLHARYRINARWEVELSAEKMLSNPDDSATSREARAVTLSALVHLTPHKQWAWYLIGGIGGTDERVSYLNAAGANVNAEIEHSHVHLGVGLERRFRRFGIGVQLRAVGMTLKHESDDDRSIQLEQPHQPGAIPEESSGAQLNVAAAYYF